MIPQHHLPADIERTSLSIITAELDAMGLTPPPGCWTPPTGDGNNIFMVRV